MKKLSALLTALVLSFICSLPVRADIVDEPVGTSTSDLISTVVLVIAAALLASAIALIVTAILNRKRDKDKK